jgi:hypothetical protein
MQESPLEVLSGVLWLQGQLIAKLPEFAAAIVAVVQGLLAG